ncbi:hypothetical protein CRG98_050386 [Punica granatum]|uniref:Uncharacterized protein n=1 Tax=Punica granatum TaxID=22663 RepID=A0A2I0GBQ3_PUNGR|nr:hypothetical protein CRG98_050386 [Punica granatum]
MRVAASLVPDGSDTAPNPKPMPRDQIGKDVSATEPFVDKNATDAAPSRLGNCEAQHCGPPIVLHGLNPLEKNSSNQTRQITPYDGQIFT